MPQNFHFVLGCQVYATPIALCEGLFSLQMFFIRAAMVVLSLRSSRTVTETKNKGHSTEPR